MEHVWIWGVMMMRGATPFFMDIQSAEDLALNPVFHKRSQHIAIIGSRARRSRGEDCSVGACDDWRPDCGYICEGTV